MNVTDALDLDAIEARANAAPKGPWAWQANEKGYPQQIVGNDDGLILVAETFIGPEHFPSEAEFIAHARTDVPALIAALREAEAKLAAIRAHLDHVYAEDDEGEYGNIPDIYDPDFYRGLDFGLSPLRAILTP